MSPLKFEPILKTIVWGGEKIAPYKGIETDQKHIGESWELSGVAGNESVVAEGPLKGKTIAQLDVRRKYGINIIGIREQGQDMASVGPDTVLSSSQRMMVTGDKKTIYKIFMRE